MTDLSQHASAAGIEVETKLDAAPAFGEPHLLERAVANLIDNGIRHNVSGGELSITTGSDNGSAWLRVRNDGRVIAAEAARELVEPFRRLDRNVGGFGLGLSIVRSVAQAHGGSLDVAAPQKGGLDVRLSLPADDGQHPAPPPRRLKTLTRS